MSNKVVFSILLLLNIFIILFREKVFANIEIPDVFYNLTLIPMEVFMLMLSQIMIKYFTFKASYKILIFIYPFFAFIFSIMISKQMLDTQMIENYFTKSATSLYFIFHCLPFFVITIKLLKDIFKISGIFKISERKIENQSIFENTIHYSNLMIISIARHYISVNYKTYFSGFISLFLVLYLYYHNAIKNNSEKK